MDTHTNTKDAEMEVKGVNDGANRTMSVDDELLQQLGHVQELRREFSVWSLGSLCLCLMATWEALSSVVAAALTNGGAPCLFYN
jgi:choline transport protein